MANDTQIIIGKRVPFGGIVGGAVGFGVWLYNVRHPELPIPAEQAVLLTTLLTGIGQVFIANKFGITTSEASPASSSD